MEIKLNSDISEYNYISASKQLLTPIILGYSIIQLSSLILIIVGYIVTVFLNQKHDTGDYNFITYIALSLGILIFLASIFYRSRRIQLAYQQSPIRQGTQNIKMDKHGLHFENPACKIHYYWTAITGILENKDGLILLIGEIDYYPIPTNALPSNLSKNEIKIAISEWISKN